MKDSAPDVAAEAARLKERGNAHKAQGRPEEAAECYRRALELVPAYGPALYNLAVVLQEGGRLVEAEPLFRRLRELDPRDRDALFRLGLVLGGQERHVEAAEAYRQALAVDADNPLLWFELGKTLRVLHEGAEAIECLSRALKVAPDLDEAHNVLGMALQDQGKLDDAIEHYRKAIALDPKEPSYFNNLGSALGLKGVVEEAIAALCSAVALRPDDVVARRNLGELYNIKGRRDLAASSFAAAYELAPDDPHVAANLLFGMLYLCDWSRFDELCEVRRRNIFTNPGTRVDCFSLLPIPSTRAEQLEDARNYTRRINRATASDRARLRFAFKAGPRARLRIGYLSADLQEHATAHLMAELFELHDRGRFEVVAYSFGPDDGSAMRARLLRGFDRFVDIGSSSHVEAARAIHADGIDILFDLKGYTANARPEILALRPAPVQVSYIGYPGTMGCEFIDYIIGDRIVTPAEHAADYSEKIVRLPGCYQVNDRKRPLGETPARRALGLPEGAVVFFCFNQTYKILPETFRAWMRILAAAPGSVLWLLEWTPETVANLRREAAARGVDPARLVFAPLVPHGEHMARIGAADLLLDTRPYNAHTTASDALWRGVPVLTCPGDTFASRVAASQLMAVGMPELIASSMAEYEAMAVRLARNPAELAALRQKVARNRATCALFDTPAFTRALERALERMWELYAAGQPPAQIDLT